MHYAITAGIFMLLLAGSHSVFAQTGQIAQLGWLAGCWAAENRDAGSGEHWLPLAGGTMLGVGRTVKNGTTIEHEFLQIRTDAQGKVVYIALPSGQKETRFVASDIADNSAVFENPQHDFPQRIIYKLSAPDLLIARAEGLRGGTNRGIDFPMKRVKCEELAGK